MDLSAAVQKSRLDGLKALRDVLAAEIVAGPGEKQTSQTPALAARLRDVLADIDELEKAMPKGSRVDDLAKRRTARRAKPEGSVAAPRGGVKRGS